MASSNWGTDPVNFDFLIDSGLLFEINRQYLHPFGISLTINTDKTGKRSLGFKDLRSSPADMVFDKDAAAAAMQKFQRFLDQWGYQQMNRRSRKLGQSIQHVDR